MLPDPSPVLAPPSTVPWRRHPSPPVAAHVRRLGALAGALAAMVVNVGAAIVAFGLSAGFLGLRGTIDVAPSIGLGAVVFLSGTMGGWLVAPSAWRATDRLAWGVVILKLAVLAVVLGAFIVGVGGFGIGIAMQEAASGQIDAYALAPLAALAYGSVLALLGIAIYGIFALPFTLVGATIWAGVVWLIRRTTRAAAVGS